MSIFGIIGLSLLIGMAFALIGALITLLLSEDDIFKHFIISCIVGAVVFIASIFIGIGFNTEDSKIWSAKFEAQKTTIEQSLDSDVLSGLERIELVNKASELNGELAERKATSELWHYVYYDKDVYKDIEPISIN